MLLFSMLEPFWNALKGSDSLELHAYINGVQTGRRLTSTFQKQVVTQAWMKYAKSTEPIRLCGDYCRVARAWYQGVSAGAKAKDIEGPFGGGGVYSSH